MAFRQNVCPSPFNAPNRPPAHLGLSPPSDAAQNSKTSLITHENRLSGAARRGIPHLDGKTGAPAEDKPTPFIGKRRARAGLAQARLGGLRLGICRRLGKTRPAQNAGDAAPFHPRRSDHGAETLAEIGRSYNVSG